MATEQMSAIKKITIDDLQSVKHLELDFEINGVFRLDGNNDIGKSAILRGISALFQNVGNRNYKEYISDWAETFIVTADFYDGSWVTLSRGAVDFYEWSLPSGSDRAEKTKGKVPTPVADYFNLYTEEERTGTVLNFNLPGDGLPFVDTSTLDNYWLMQKALGTEDFLIGTKFLNKRARDTQKEIKVIFEIVEEQQEKLDNITNEITNDKNKKKPLDRFADIMTVEHAALLEMYALEKEEIELNTLRARLSSLVIVPEDELMSIKQDEKILSSMIDILEMENDLKDYNEKLNVVTEKLENDFDTETLVNDLETIKTATSVLTLEKELEYLRDNLTLVTKKENFLTDLKEVKELLPIIKNLQLQYTEMTSVVKERELLKDKEAQIEGILAEIEELKIELGVCPLCNSDLTDPNHNHKKGVK